MTIRDDNQCRLTSNISLEEAYSRIAQGQEGLSFLRRNDQLNVERAEGRTFHGFNEGMLCFRPTYKVCSSSYFFFFGVLGSMPSHRSFSFSFALSCCVYVHVYLYVYVYVYVYLYVCVLPLHLVFV